MDEDRAREMKLEGPIGTSEEGGRPSSTPLPPSATEQHWRSSRIGGNGGTTPACKHQQWRGLSSSSKSLTHPCDAKLCSRGVGSMDGRPPSRVAGGTQQRRRLGSSRIEFEVGAGCRAHSSDETQGGAEVQSSPSPRVRLQRHLLPRGRSLRSRCGLSAGLRVSWTKVQMRWSRSKVTLEPDIFRGLPFSRETTIYPNPIEKIATRLQRTPVIVCVTIRSSRFRPENVCRTTRQSEGCIGPRFTRRHPAFHSRFVGSLCQQQILGSG